MATITSPSASAEHQPSATAARAARVVRVGFRLLLVALLLLPLYGSLMTDGRLAARLAIVGLFCITLVQPGNGLLLCAAFLPIGLPLGLLLGFPWSIHEPLVLAFLAGWVLRETIRRRAPSDSATRALVVPALFLAAVVAASIVVQLMVLQVSEDFPWPFVGRVIGQLASDYVLGSSYPGLAPGAAMLEGLGLFVATVVLSRRLPSLAQHVAGMAVVGAAGVAALNLVRFAQICLRSGAPLQAFAANAVSLRISAVFPDFNAAGSYFAMMVFVAIGLAVVSRRTRIAWVAAAVLILTALWITGSRAALLSIPAAGVLVLVWRVRVIRRLPIRAVTPVTAALVLAVALVAWVFLRDTTTRGMPVAVQTRVELGLAALRMFASHPVFGVGVGQFWQVSGGYIEPRFGLRYYPKENAHNNYLQILAELGLTGLGLFLWSLGAVARGTRAGITERRDRLLFFAAGGILAFLLTCLTGHPLLMREVACAFWPVLGVVGALSLDGRPRGDGRPKAHARWMPFLAAGAGIFLAVSVPIRAHLFVQNEADLRHVSIGLSPWQVDEQGLRFRTMVGRAQFYIPINTCEMRLPFEADAASTEAAVDVEIRVDGRVANRVRAVSGAWRDVRMVLPIGSARHFRQIELRTLPNVNARLRVGKPRLTRCSKNPF